MAASPLSGLTGRRKLRAAAMVSSPFQVVSATEFAHRHGWQKDAALLLVPPVKRRSVVLRQMQFVASRYPWGDVRVVLPPRSALTRVARAAQVMRHLIRLRSIETLAVGDMWPSFAAYLSNLNPSRTVLLDDGMKTLRFREDALGYRTTIASKGRLKRLLVGRYDFLTPRNELEFFSALDVPTTAKVVVNDFAWLRQQLSGLPVASEAWLIGQPFVETGVFSEEEYTSFFSQALDRRNRDLPRYYFPHRREDVHAARGRASALNAEIPERSAPVELEPLVLGRVPKVLLSVASTATLSLLRTLPDETEVDVCHIPEEVAGSSARSDIPRRSQRYLIDQLSAARLRR